MSVKDIGVVGGGFAGCAAALFAARAGHRVTLYEAVPDPGPVGAGILLQPTGLYVLEQLGLAEAVIRKAARVDALRACTQGGREIFHLRYARMREDLFGLGLHRGVLFEVLFHAARAEPNVDLRLGIKIEGVNSRRRLEDQHGALHGPHDLVIVADGSVSELRTPDVPTTLDKPYPWGALWFIGQDDEELGHQHELYQVVDGPTQMLGFLPSGQAPGSNVSLTSMFWSIRVDRVETWRRQVRFQGLQVWMDKILRLEPRAESFLRQIDDIGQVLFAAYRDVRMRRWTHVHHGMPMVFIGDAAHAMSPQLGQGSNLALYDAMVLAHALDAHESTAAALRAYDHERGAHLRYYQRANRWLTPFFQSSFGPLGMFRDAVFPLMTYVPYLHDAAVQTLCGVRRGFIFADCVPLVYSHSTQ